MRLISGHNNVSPNILAKNWNFQKLRHSFVDERALITTPLISTRHWKILVAFCLWKKRPENVFLTLIVNYHNIVQIEDKLTTFNQFQIILISVFRRIKNFFYNFICFITNHDFYVVGFWMHDTLFIINLVRNKVVCYFLLNFSCVRFFEIIYAVF